MSGAALVSVQRLLGHSDPKITERRYGHLLPDFMAAEVNRLRFGLDHLVPRPLGTSLVQSADPEKREAGAPLFSAGIPASLLAGCRGLEPLASGVTGKLVVCQCVAARRNRLESLETARTRKRTLRRIWQPFARRRLQLQSREGCPGGGGPARFLAVRDVAAALGVTPATIYKLCKQGKLLHARVSNAIRVPEAALAKYLAAGRSPPGPAESVPDQEKGPSHDSVALGPGVASWAGTTEGRRGPCACPRCAPGAPRDAHDGEPHRPQRGRWRPRSAPARQGGSSRLRSAAANMARKRVFERR
jgi:excisionase family DNA binding protein